MHESISILANMVRFPRRSESATYVNPFCEVRRSVIHGRGVFAHRSLRKGVRIIEYLGERIDKDESNRRGLELFEKSKQTGEASVFIFDVNEDWDLDGNKCYNHARLINHSCDPNCEMVNEDDRLFLYTIKEIKKGEELSFDYGYEVEHFLDHPCRCGSANCVGYIVAQSQWKRLKQILNRSKKKKNVQV